MASTPTARSCRLRSRRAGAAPGYRPLPDHAEGLPDLAGLGPGPGRGGAFGVEGTGCYGAALARFPRAQGRVVFEVNRPNRQARRYQALYRIVVVRLRWHQPTRDYLAPANQGGLVEAGGHPVPKALRGPRGLRSLARTRRPVRCRLTIYRSVTAEVAVRRKRGRRAPAPAGGSRTACSVAARAS